MPCAAPLKRSAFDAGPAYAHGNRPSRSGSGIGQVMTPRNMSRASPSQCRKDLSISRPGVSTATNTSSMPEVWTSRRTSRSGALARRTERAGQAQGSRSSSRHEDTGGLIRPLRNHREPVHECLENVRVGGKLGKSNEGGVSRSHLATSASGDGDRHISFATAGAAGRAGQRTKRTSHADDDRAPQEAREPRDRERMPAPTVTELTRILQGTAGTGRLDVQLFWSQVDQRWPRSPPGNRPTLADRGGQRRGQPTRAMQFYANLARRGIRRAPPNRAIPAA